MSDYLMIGVLWLVPVFAVAAYLFTRRFVPPSRSLPVFDSTVLFFVLVLCVAVWWREITGHISTHIRVDERGFMLILVPMWTSFISIPLLLVAALARLIVYSRPQPDATRAI
jgi:hypothetical protein